MSNHESVAHDFKVKEAKDADAASPNVIVVIVTEGMDVGAMLVDEVSEWCKDKWYWLSDGGEGEPVDRSPSPWLFDPDHELVAAVLPGL